LQALQHGQVTRTNGIGVTLRLRGIAWQVLIVLRT